MDIFFYPASGGKEAINPVDILPDFLPIVGQLDDLVLLGIAVKMVSRSLPRSLIMEHLRRAALTRE